MPTANIRRPVLLAVAVAAALTLAGTPARADAPAHGAAKATCAKEKKALQRASAKRRAGARKRYQACKDKALAGEIRTQLADRRLTGRRGDGESVNWLFCSSGKYRLESSGRSGRGISTGSTWVVTQARGTATKWTAIVRESANLRAAGLSVGLARSGAQYFAGVASGADVMSQGPVTVAPDAAACGALQL